MNDDSIVDPTQWFKSEVGDQVEWPVRDGKPCVKCGTRLALNWLFLTDGNLMCHECVKAGMRSS